MGTDELVDEVYLIRKQDAILTDMINYFGVSKKKNKKPKVWYENKVPKKYSKNNRYLWFFTHFVYSDGTIIANEPKIINFSKKESDGK